MFSKPTFGQSNPPAFGGFSSPGTSNTAGASAPFGQNTFNKPAASTTGFPAPSFGGGGSTMFGGGTTTTGTGMFGNTAAPAFGQPTQQTQPGFSGFNAGSNAPLFGANSGVSSFAQPKPTFGGFGTTTSSAGLFGAQPTVSGTTAGQPGNSLFNQGANLFGSAIQRQAFRPSFGTSGATGGAATQGTPIKFNPPTGTDSMAKNGITSTINTRHQCITCMKEYENKSLEELRLEDLQAGRKGPTGGDGLFGGAGTNQPGQQSLFGSPSMAQPGASATGFGENKSLFGQPATTSSGLGGFGSTAPAFGSTQASGGLFGKPTGFGTTTNTTASGFSFNNNNNNNNAAAANPFGAANQPKPFGAAPTASLFGAQQNTGTMFGAQNTAGFGGFGTPQNQQQGIGLFGQNKTATPFGIGAQQQQQQQQPAASTGFGFAQNTVNNTQAGGLFGAKPTLSTGLSAPAFGSNNMFGAKPAGAAAPVFGNSSFGSPATTGLGGTTNLFGQQQFNKPGATAQPFGFGQQQGGATTALGGGTGLGTQGGLFNSLGKPATSVGMFGTSGGSLFGTNTSTAQNTGFNLGSGLNFNSTSGTSGGLTLGQNNSLGFGNKPMFSGLSNTMGVQSTGPTEDPHKRMLALCAYPYGDRALFRNLPSDFSKLDEMRLKSTSPAMQKVAVNQSPAFNISTGKPKLPVSPLTSTPAKKSMFEGLDTTPSIIGSTESITPSFNVRRLNLRTKLTKPPAQAETIETPERNDTSEFTRSPVPIASWLTNIPESSPSSNRGGASLTETPKSTKDRETEAETSVSDVVPPRRLAMEELPTILNDSNVSVSLSFSDTSENRSHEEVLENDVTREPHPAGIILNRTDYYTIPSLTDLAKMTDENGRCIVPNFTIGRENYGNVYFEDSFDISGLNLDALVHIRHKEVVVHPDDELKPPLGEGLNRRAQVTLDRVYPINKQTRTPITDPEALTEMNYEDHLRQTCVRMKVRFLEYRPDTGSWVFKVDHFSKYGVDEDDAENEENLAPAGANKTRPEAAKAAPQKVPIKQQPLQPMQKPVPATPHHSADVEAMDEGFPEAQSPTDQLSRMAGTDTSKMRLMKASLFAMDEDTDYKDSEAMDERRGESQQGGLIEPMYDTPPPSVGFSAMYEAEVRMQEEETEETLPRRPHQHPSLVTPKLSSLPLRTPLALSKCIPDAGLFMARHFTPSWGPGCRLLLCDGFSLSQFSPYQHTPSFMEWVECHLTIQLRHTAVHEDSGLVPRRGARLGLGALEDHCDTLEQKVDQNHREKTIRQVLHLCLALWGDLKALSEDSPATLVAHERRRAVSEWLLEVMSSERETEKHSGIMQVVKNLTRGQLLDSVVCSQQMGDHYSAMVLATAGSATYPRQLVQRQLQEWVGDNIASLVNPQRLRCWLLAGAGLPVLSLEDGDTLNALHGLDWIYCLAAHFWYLSSSAASIPDILTRYEEAFTGPHSYAAAPVPPGGSEENLDIRFHLLKLFSQRTHPLEQLLCVETHFPESQLDFSLGWLLLQLLDALNYTHVSEHCSQGLHLAFAEQLEAAGLWQWAIFVLQHISQPDMRSSAVEKVIGRHVTLDPNSWSSPDDLQPLEEFVVSKLGVPAKMVFEAKAYLAACRQKHAETACYQLYAGNWSGCHTTIINHLVSDAIINEDFKLLLRLLRALRPHGSEINGWESSGQVFLNYLSLMEDLRGLQPEGIAESSSVRSMGNLEAMHQRVMTLISQISGLPSETPKARLCQSEIARRIIVVARSLVSPSDDSAAAVKMTNAIIHLPLPDDYHLQELLYATRLYLKYLPN